MNRQDAHLGQGSGGRRGGGMATSPILRAHAVQMPSCECCSTLLDELHSLHIRGLVSVDMTMGLRVVGQSPLFPVGSSSHLRRHFDVRGSTALFGERLPHQRLCHMPFGMFGS
jgi:hypothetical protein